MSVLMGMSLLLQHTTDCRITLLSAEIIY